MGRERFTVQCRMLLMIFQRARVKFIVEHRVKFLVGASSKVLSGASSKVLSGASGKIFSRALCGELLKVKQRSAA